MEIDRGKEIACGVGRREGLDGTPNLRIGPVLVDVEKLFAQRDGLESVYRAVGCLQHLCPGARISGDGGCGLRDQITIEHRVDEIFRLFFRQHVVLVGHDPLPGLPGGGGFGQNFGHPGRLHHCHPNRRIFPFRVESLELLGVLVGVHPADAATGLAQQGRHAGGFVIEPGSKACMGLEFFRLRQVDVERGVDVVARCSGIAVFVIPLLQCDHGTWNGLGDDLVFDRAEQHVRDRCDEAYQNEQEQRGDQRQGPQFLAAKRDLQAFLQRSAVSRKHGAS
ncbi:hypothetical protein OEG86_24505 [Hoeflea alexandrii]|uniref:hypothetical protein n=1 Tax=Hoeflea alexandrii TaxID=288436 RepID=UPI00226EFECD|nr:hypothetical protein [Hoeflea alexandrii]MCY0154855.1 hypothetical protein [Hoeflea alexandrii]